MMKLAIAYLLGLLVGPSLTEALIDAQHQSEGAAHLQLSSTPTSSEDAGREHRALALEEATFNPLIPGRVCCMAYSLTCLAACAGMSEDEFCDRMHFHPLCPNKLGANLS